MKIEKRWDNLLQDSKRNLNYWLRFMRLIPDRQLILSVFYGILRVVIATVWPFFLYRSIQKIGVTSNTDLVFSISIVAILLGMGSVAAHFQSQINIRILKGFTLDLVDRIWKKMNALEWKTFHNKNRVYFFDMLMIETWRLRAGIGAILETLIINTLIAGLLSLLIAFISLPLFLACLIGLCFMGIGYYISTSRSRRLLKKFHAAWRIQHLWVAKCVDQFDLVKMGRGYEESATENLKQSGVFFDSNAHLLTNQANWRNINQLVANVVRIALFVLGIYWVRTNLVGLDDLLLVLLILTIVQSNISQIPTALSSFIEAQESLLSITNFFQLADEQKSEDEPRPVLLPVRKIAIRNLSYQYEDRPVMKYKDLVLEAGKIYLWRGENGSGKSTAAHILLGLLHPPEGSLAINNQDADWKELSNLRGRFAFLNQDSPIFMGTIKENALFGHSNIEKAWELLQKSWLSALLPKNDPKGERLVGERGEGLSGGQAKRVALVRELLRDSDLLILDEPLNHLDEFAIDEIKREIMELKARTIIIIISHQKGFESIADEIRQF